MKKFLKRLLFFSTLGIFVILSVFYTRLLLGIEYPELKTLNNALNQNCDVILLGSSVNRHSAKSDTDKRAISEMLNDNISDKEIIGISHEAYQLDIFCEIIKYIIKNKKDDNLTVIVPVNLRSFGPLWDFRPTYQFTKEKYNLLGLPYVINFKKYRTISNDEFESLPIVYENKQIGTVEDLIDVTKPVDPVTDLRLGFISNYMQPINKDNDKLLKLKEIDQLSKLNDDLEIVFYITPIDFMKAENLPVNGFKEQVLKNIKTIKSTIHYSELIDLSFEFDSNQFDYKRRPNEHLNMFGRRNLSKQLESTLTNNEETLNSYIN